MWLGTIGVSINVCGGGEVGVDFTFVKMRIKKTNFHFDGFDEVDDQ